MKRNLCIYLFLLLFFGFTSLYADAPQPVVPEWESTFGGVRDDMALDFMQTKSGDFVLVGFTKSANLSNPRSDAMVVKTDANGDKLWEKVMWGSHNGGRDAYDSFHSVKETRDGGYILAGESQARGGSSFYAWLIKLDQGGNLLWEKLINPQYTTSLRAVMETPDGDFVATGRTSYSGRDWDGYVLKVSANGGLLWQRILDFDQHRGNEYFEAMAETDDNGYIIVGQSYDGHNLSTVGKDFLLVKIDASGNPVWMKKMGGTGNEVCYDIKRTSDNGYILAGSTESYGAGGRDAWVVKIDAAGYMIWNQTYGGTGNEGALSVTITKTGFAVSGSTNSYGEGLADIYIIHTDHNGVEELSQTLGGADNDVSYAISSASDGGFHVAGYISPGGVARDVYLAKLPPVKKPEYTLTVQSTPVTGVQITVSPDDLQNLGDGLTNFTRTYESETVVSLTASARFNDKIFSKWLIDGVENTNPTIQVTMDDDRTVQAVYIQEPPKYTLTVLSTHGKGVNIAVTPNDLNGSGDGATTFTRTYYEGTSVTLAAPAMVDGKHTFDHWKIDGGTKIKSAIVQIEINGHHRVKAYFVTPKGPKGPK